MLSPLVFLYVIFLVERIHARNIEKDQGNKSVDRTLLREPKAEFEPSKFNRIQCIDKQNAGAE